MATEESAEISKADQAELQHLANLLHLFHHRNKNQHRRSIWWRHFSVFRKQLSALVADLCRLNEVATTNLGRTKKKAQDAQIHVTTTKRIIFWRDVMVWKWQHAFSQLVADGRFSVLGLVLLAALSQVCQIVGMTAELGELGQAEVERVLEEFGREAWEIEAVHGQPAATEDLGEVVQRDEAPAQLEGEMIMSWPPESREDISARAPARTATTAAVKSPKKRAAIESDKPSKKKRKKGNAIDDIFG